MKSKLTSAKGRANSKKSKLTPEERSANSKEVWANRTSEGAVKDRKGVVSGIITRGAKCQSQASLGEADTERARSQIETVDQGPFG